MRTTAVLLLLGATLSADVVVLKDGTKVAGRVADKGASVEVASDAGLRTFLKEEVEKVVKSPKELLGDSEKVLEEAKQEYEQALAAPAAEQNFKLKAAIAKATRAREAYAQARELFPEDQHADLDLKLVQVMQLMRLLRERVGSEVARRGPAVVNAAPPLLLPDAVAVLADPAKRGDPAKRAAARDSFRFYRSMHPEIHDLAAAAMAFLARPEADWRLDAPAQKALQDYFAKPWLKEPLKIAPEGHLAAASFLADQAAALRKANPQAPVEALALFGSGHLGHAPTAEPTARALGLSPLDGAWGTAEGHAIRDLNAWIASGDFDLAVLAFVKEHRQADTAAVRFVWSTALLRLVQKKQRGFDRPVSALLTVKSPEIAVNDHVAAMVKSIKAVASCSNCLGEGRLRCTNCFGRKEVRFNCAKCTGTGKVMPPGSNTPGVGGGGKFGRFAEPIDCYPCRGRGFEKLIKCEKCKDGSVDCRQCETPKPPPELSEICAASACPQCDGRGLLFRKVHWPCRGCLGTGQRFVPKADPAKVLP